MPGRPAARILDPVAHPIPGMLIPGPGSFNVIIGGKPAWRGVTAGAAAAIQAAKATSDATIKVAEAATLAAAGTPAAPAAKAAEETVKAAAAASMASMIAGAAGGADIHACLTPLPLPPHGPGVVVDGSTTVFFNNLPACRQGDTIVEPVGPPDKIVLGLPTVLIGDAGGAAGKAYKSTPTLDDLLKDPLVDAELKKAWNESNPNAPEVKRGDPGSTKHEQGGGIYWNKKSGQLKIERVPAGTRDGNSGAPPGSGDWEKVAEFHTHPNTSGEGYSADPSPADKNYVKNTSKVPEIIETHDGRKTIPYP